jgi:hypothetical protein
LRNQPRAAAPKRKALERKLGNIHRIDLSHHRPARGGDPRRLHASIGSGSQPLNPGEIL